MNMISVCVKVNTAARFTAANRCDWTRGQSQACADTRWRNFRCQHSNILSNIKSRKFIN